MMEKCFLNSNFKERPREITVILGPKSSGKTELLESFYALGGMSMFGSYLYARATFMSEPKRYAAALFTMG